MDVVRVLKFPVRIAGKDAKGFCTGRALLPAYRDGPWTWKKAVCSIIDRFPGHHVRWWSLEAKDKSSSKESTWGPDDNELLRGVTYVNQHAPEDDSENQQYLWILLNIRPDSGSPIAGWPESKVIRMAQNKSRATAGATSSRFFPMTTRSLKPFMGDFLIPLICPLLSTYGIVTLGWPGVGKTPLLIILCLALGRYHIDRLNLEGVFPGWRRAKAMDNFRHKSAQIHEGLILDDPQMEKLDTADVKSWLTSEEDQNCSGRYTDVKLVRNGLRALASNAMTEEDEPQVDKHRVTIEPKDFFKLIDKFFADYKDLDKLAILKRCAFFVFGQRALYLRLPSQDREAIVHCIQVEDTHLDLFTQRDKDFYAKYKLGIQECPPTFEDDVKLEKSMIQNGMEELRLAGRPEAYLSDINDKINAKLTRMTLQATAVHLPSSPSTDEEARVPVPLPEAPPVQCTNPPGRLGQFQYPPTKRLCKKTSMSTDFSANLLVNHDSAAVASSSAAEQEVSDKQGPEDLATPPTAEDMDSDEDAARHLHS